LLIYSPSLLRLFPFFPVRADIKPLAPTAEQSALSQMEGFIHQGLQVDHVFPVVGEEGGEGGVIAPAVAVPEEHGLVAVHPVYFRGAVNAEAGLDLFQAAPEAQAGQDKAEIQMDRGEPETWEIGPKYRQVELGAVKGDDQVQVFQGLGKFLQVFAVDELAHGGAVIKAHHCHLQPRPGIAGGFNVQVRGPLPEAAEETPALRGGEQGTEIPGVVLLGQGLFQAAPEVHQPFAAQPRYLPRGQEVLPGMEALAPEMGLGALPHAGEMDEGAFKHYINISLRKYFCHEWKSVLLRHQKIAHRPRLLT